MLKIYHSMGKGTEMEKIFHSGFANPFLPLDIYIPDGEPKVFEGRVWLYGSKDIFGGEYCCHKYHVYSAPVDDLEEWTDHGPAFASTDEYVQEGISDGVPWSDGLLWAPDVAKKGDWYYLYFCLSDGSEGVARSRKPGGPFTDAKRITMGGKPIEGIDPSVLQDGDSYYYTWGQAHCQMARLNEDMCSLDETTYVPALISNGKGKEGFHEGSSLRKIGEKYCIVYASEYTDIWPNRGGSPTCLDYAVSDSIYGPYMRKGRIIDNAGIDPSSWNNHGSIVRIKDQWYVFYHGSSNHSKYTRRCRVERIEVDEEQGLITQVRMTSSGFAEYLDPEKRTEAAWACEVTGGAFFTEKEGKHPMVNITRGCSASYCSFDFGNRGGLWDMEITVKPMQGGKLRVFAGEEEAASAIISKEMEKDAGFVIHEAETMQIPLGRLQGKKKITLYFDAEHGKLICELFDFCMRHNDAGQ